LVPALRLISGVVPPELASGDDALTEVTGVTGAGGE
jgi:hypothetical protein